MNLKEFKNDNAHLENQQVLENALPATPELLAFIVG